MVQGIKISIPTPCHENWQDMTPADRGRFCAACQKTVVDFTRATDREIVAAYNGNEKLCGRFLNTQLDRELVFPKEKNSLWAGAAALALLSLGTTAANAQTSIQTEQTEPDSNNRHPLATPRTITGNVYYNIALAGCTVMVNNTNSGTTDKNGKFSVTAKTGDYIQIIHDGFETAEIKVTDESYYKVMLSRVVKQEVHTTIMGKMLIKPKQ
ncbi:peptidase associated/transthyretin-like domain-containing protein [Flavobacterium akiainvivens]|uniref:hypothetical protein n=1 Tax=Flavobacterium akiainvivens TaxID=1202724 RepID=UPI0008E3BF74|nr:hypothetical protein [Flavobacterium akiainvivens]SFQ40914.1 hypothetical protein SAMN05444144_10472 [Flavobacterium akiainvivens]